MTKQSKTLAYALECLKELEDHAQEYVLVAEIARKRGTPPAYCQKVLRKLALAGLAHSEKGKGFMMAKPAAEISLDDLRKALLSRPKP